MPVSKSVEYPLLKPVGGSGSRMPLRFFPVLDSRPFAFSKYANLTPGVLNGGLNSIPMLLTAA